MLEYSTYSVISPEGCASILWKSVDKAAEAAEAMGITSSRLKELGLIDRVVPEPLGGAHRAPSEMADNLRKAIVEELDSVAALDSDAMLQARYDRLLSYGRFKD